MPPSCRIPEVRWLGPNVGTCFSIRKYTAEMLASLLSSHWGWQWTTIVYRWFPPWPWSFLSPLSIWHWNNCILPLSYAIFTWSLCLHLSHILTLPVFCVILKNSTSFISQTIANVFPNVPFIGSFWYNNVHCLFLFSHIYQFTSFLLKIAY